MGEILAIVVVIVLILLGLAGALTWTGWFRNRRLTTVDVFVAIALITVLVTFLLSVAADSADLFVFGLFIIVFLGAIVAFVGFLTSLFVIPDAASAVRSGWIRVRPQLFFRRKITKAVIDHARAITRMNLPLAEGFYLAGRQTSGRSGVVLEAMASFLQQGLKLSEAYSRYKARSALVLSMMQAGERCGQLPGVLGYLQEYFDRERKQRQQWIPAWWPYPIILLSALLMVGTFLMVVIVPKYEAIFRDFGTNLPTITQTVIYVANGFAAHLGAIWLLAILVAALVLLRLLPRRHPRARLYERVADWLVWMAPGFGAKEAYTNLAHAASVLRLSLGSGMTMPQAVQCTAGLDLNTVLRRRLVRFHDRLVRGESSDAAGRREHLPARFLWALRPGQDAEAMQASLELIERYYSLVASHWYMAINALVWPLVVLGLGTLVGMFALAFFLPLVRLIEAVSGL